jgi:hypothetical protein
MSWFLQLKMCKRKYAYYNVRDQIYKTYPILSLRTKLYLSSCIFFNHRKSLKIIFLSYLPMIVSNIFQGSPSYIILKVYLNKLTSDPLVQTMKQCPWSMENQGKLCLLYLQCLGRVLLGEEKA